MNKRQEQWINAYKTASDKNRSMGDNYYTVVDFDMDEFRPNYIMVSRKYRPTNCENVFYVDCFILGPKCGTKKIYDRLH